MDPEEIASLKPGSPGATWRGPGLIAPSTEESPYTAAAKAALDARQYQELTHSFPEYLKAARLARCRYLVTATAKDQPGVVAELAQHLARLELSIDDAAVELVAGQVTVMITVREVQSEDGGVERITGHFAREPFERLVREQLDIVEVPIVPKTWPRPGSRLLRLLVETPDTSGVFAAITGVIGTADIPLHSASSWVDDDVCRIDLLLAVPPGFEEEAVRGLREALGDELGPFDGSVVDWRYVDDPPPHPIKRSWRAPKGTALAISLVGYARPGLVHSALAALPPSINVLGSAMAILEGITGFLFIVDLPEETSVESLEAAVRTGVSNHDASSQSPFESRVQSHPLERFETVPEWPPDATHSILCESPDRVGVLADLASAVAECDANIVRLRAGVRRDFATGERTCLLTLDVGVEDVVRLRRALGALAENHPENFRTLDLIDL